MGRRLNPFPLRICRKRPGCRCIIIALLGWLILSGQSPKQSNKAEQGNTRATISNSVQTVPLPSIKPIKPIQKSAYEKPCWDKRDHRDSDLCAQWKAADGANEAAYWAKWSFFVAIAGTFGLFITIWYTRKALRLAIDASQDADKALIIAGRNADAAAAHVKVAQETAAAQLRPHVYLARCKIEYNYIGMIEAMSNTAPVTFYFRNFGQTPAKNVTLQANTPVGGYWSDDFVSDLPEKATVPLGDMPQGRVIDRDGYTIVGLAEAHKDIVNSDRSVFLEGTLRYEDWDGNEYTTRFRWVATGPEYWKGTLTVAPYGNEAS